MVTRTSISSLPSASPPDPLSVVTFASTHSRRGCELLLSAVSHPAARTLPPGQLSLEVRWTLKSCSLRGPWRHQMLINVSQTSPSACWHVRSFLPPGLLGSWCTVSYFDLLCTVLDREETEVPQIACFCQNWEYNKGLSWLGSTWQTCTNPDLNSANRPARHTRFDQQQGQRKGHCYHHPHVPHSQPSLMQNLYSYQGQLMWQESTRKDTTFSGVFLGLCFIMVKRTVSFFYGYPAKEMCRTPSHRETWKLIALLSWVSIHTTSALLAVPHGSPERLCHIWEPHGYPAAWFSGPAELELLLILPDLVVVASDWVHRVPVPDHLVTTHWSNCHLHSLGTGISCLHCSPLHFTEMPSVQMKFVQRGLFLNTLVMSWKFVMLTTPVSSNPSKFQWTFALDLQKTAEWKLLGPLVQPQSHLKSLNFGSSTSFEIFYFLSSLNFNPHTNTLKKSLSKNFIP